MTQTFSIEAASLATNTVRQRETPGVPYEVCAYETRTGIVRKWLPIADFPDWQQGLNLQGDWEVSVPLNDKRLTKQDLINFATPWYFSWAVCQGMKIWQAGPVVPWDYTDQDSFDKVTVSGIGMWKFITDKRVLLNPARAARGKAAAIDADVAFGTGTVSATQAPIPVANRNLALASVAARLVEIMLSEPGGDLPIDVGDTTIAGTSEQNYPGFELSSWGARLADLAGLDSGPEQYFDPYFVDPTRKLVRFDHRIGNPRLGAITPAQPPVWDLGKALVSCGVSNDGSNQTYRSFMRGSGSDRNTVIGFAENLDGVTFGVNPNNPLLETVDSTHSQTELQATNDSWAAADVATNRLPILTLSPKVRMMGDAFGQSTRSPQLSQISPGDVVQLRMKKHPVLPDGRYTVRVLKLRSARDAMHAYIDVQLLTTELDS